MGEDSEEKIFTDTNVNVKYVAFIDLLGFSNKVLANCEETIDIYEQMLQSTSKISVLRPEVQITVYSDSFLLTSNEFLPLVDVSRGLLMQTLFNNYLVRGGIAYGKHIESSMPPHLFVVSEALIKAAALEKTIKNPCIAIHPDIIIKDEWWSGHDRNITRDLLYFGGHIIVNPCNPLWGLSAGTRVKLMQDEIPQHREKYDWFLQLHEAIFSPVPMIPPKFFSDPS